jgi:VWFA-related protein
MHRHQRLVFLIVLGLALAGHSRQAVVVGQAAPPQSATQQTQPPPQGQTMFRASVDVVAVDVSVIDRSGRPIRDLALEEFSLTVDGKPRRLRSAEFIALRRAEGAPAAAPRPFSTNLGTAPGRLVMLVIDQANIRRGSSREAFAAARRFIESLNDSDRVGLQVIPGAGPIVDFTSNHTRVMMMLDNVMGHAVEAEQSGRVGIAEAVAIAERDDESTWQEVLERECAGDHDPTSLDLCRQKLLGEVRVVHAAARSNTESSLLSLRQLMDRLSLTPDAKTLVLISEGLIVDRDFVDLNWVAPRAAAARVNIFGIRLSAPHYDAAMSRTSPTREVDQRLRAEGMDMLVSAARGTVFPVAVNADAAFSRLDLEISAYYLLSFEPDAADRNGRPHDIAVKVKRSGATVRARQQFVADPPGAVMTLEQMLTETLRSSLGAADFGLKLTTYSYRDAASDRVKVIVATEIDGAAKPDVDFAIGFYVTDSSGALAAADASTNERAGAGAPGRPHVQTAAVVLDAGSYTIKLAAVDAEGRRASVERSFDARLTRAGQLAVSDVMFARPAETARDVRPVIDGVLDATVTAYAEVYSDVAPQLDRAGVAVEFAESEEGPAIVSMALPLSPAESGRRIGAASLPAELVPGRYVARLVLKTDDRPIWSRSQPVIVIAAPANAARRPAAGRPATPAPAPARPPTAALPPAEPVAFDYTTDQFDHRLVLARPVVGFFIDRLSVVGLPPMPASLAPAVGLARMGNFAQARTVAEAAASGHVVEPFLVGLALLAGGDVNGAATRFGEVLRGAPELAPAAFYLGACFAAAGQDREASQAWQSILITDPSAPWTYTLLADSLLRADNVRMAMTVLGEARALWPDQDDVRLRWARAQARAGDGADAVRTLEPYLTRRPADGDALMLAMRLIYEARVMERPVETTAADRARFVRYYDAYAKLPGVDLTQASEWRTFVDR